MSKTLVYLEFGDVSRKLLGMQCQYAVRYLDTAVYPELSAGIRWIGDLSDYHFVQIHRDDASIFAARVQDWRRKNGQI